MSWDQYIDTLKTYSPNDAISEGLIVGKGDGQPWTAQTTHLQGIPKEVVDAVKIKKPSSIEFAGTKYMFLRVLEEDDGTYYVLYKKKDVGALCIYVTTQTLIFAFTEESKTHNVGEANEATKKIAAYLVSLGY